MQNKTNPGTLINSCCKDTVPCTVQKAYENNCSDELADNLGSILKAIGIVAIVFGAIEVRISNIFQATVTTLMAILYYSVTVIDFEVMIVMSHD